MSQQQSNTNLDFVAAPSILFLIKCIGKVLVPWLLNEYGSAIDDGGDTLGQNACAVIVFVEAVVVEDFFEDCGEDVKDGRHLRMERCLRDGMIPKTMAA